MSDHGKTKEKVEAVLLDVDGTLVDSNAQHAESWQRTFAHFGIEVKFDAVLHQIGKGGDTLLPVFVPKEKLPEVGDAMQAFRSELFKQEYRDTIAPFPDVRKLIERMKQSGLRIALASSATKEELPHYKKLAHIEDLVEEETTSSDAEQSKPNPDIFQAALERLGVSADRTISVGDTPYDAQASAKAGVRTIGFTSGGWAKKDLLDAGCIEVYEGAADLLAHFDESVLNAA